MTPSPSVIASWLCGIIFPAASRGGGAGGNQRLRNVLDPCGDDFEIVAKFKLFAGRIRRACPPCVNVMWRAHVKLNIRFFRVPFDLQVAICTGHDLRSRRVGATNGLKHTEREICRREGYRYTLIPIPAAL